MAFFFSSLGAPSENELNLCTVCDIIELKMMLHCKMHQIFGCCVEINTCTMCVCVCMQKIETSLVD